jgi:hypothetical protein
VQWTGKIPDEKLSTAAPHSVAGVNHAQLFPEYSLLLIPSHLGVFPETFFREEINCGTLLPSNLQYLVNYIVHGTCICSMFILEEIN